MHRALIIFLFSSGFFSVSFGQKNTIKIHGTVQIDEYTSMKETEVTIQEWLCFIVNNNIDESLFPDSKSVSTSAKLLYTDLKKRKDFKYVKVVNNDKVTSKYFGEKGVETTKEFKMVSDADSNYFSTKIPVTGITFEQVQRFCRWKEGVVNMDRQVKITISLPPVEMYKRVITNIDSLSKNKKCYVLNCSNSKCDISKNKKANKENKMLSTQGLGLEMVNSYFPTTLGLYNLQGNAAEMTEIYGIAMGGSFRQPARESYNDKSQHYDKAQDWLGFRYIVTVK